MGKWKKVFLTDICYPKQWKTVSTADLLPSGYPVYGANGVIGYYNSYNHEKPTILITCRGATCGEINICCEKAYINGNAMCLDNLSDDVNIQYLYYILKNFDFSNVISGSAQPQITREGLRKVQIPLPDLFEQQKIAATLDKVTDLINLRKKELERLDLLVKSRFVEMFENNCYPVFRLGDVCSKITDGTHKTPIYLDSGVPFISAKNIVNGELDFSDIKYISEHEYAEIQKRCQTEIGDILLSKSGSLGSPVIVKTSEKIGLFESLAVIKYDRNKLLPEFLCEQINSDIIQRQFKAGTKGVAIKHLHLGVIADIDVIVPPIDKQSVFANVVKQTDKSKYAVKKSLEKLKTLKKALMQEYFG